MKSEKVNVNFVLNGKETHLDANPRQTLLDFLRSLSLASVKNGCGEGDCGMCTILLDGKPVRSCMLKTPEIEGKEILTLEGLQKDGKLHPIQRAFMETGAIQCGFCTPAHIMTTKALLDQNPSPTEEEVKNALSGILCRCTGFVRILEAVHRAAAILRGEKVKPLDNIEFTLPDDLNDVELPGIFYRQNGETAPLPVLIYSPKEMEKTEFIGKPAIKVDAKKLAEGKPVFTDDVNPPGMLYGVLLTSPHAHARIKDIDTSKAEALPGVQAVLTYKDVPRVKYASGGQSYPQPLPFDQASLDNKVRHVGDRVAIVAADTLEIANKASRLIKVDYEILPAVFDSVDAMKEGAPVIHDEEDSEGIYDAKRNIIYHIEEEVGDVNLGFDTADLVVEGTFSTPRQQHAHMEPHVTITYWDEDDRLVVRTSTQVPFHARRIIAPLIGLPVKKIRVIKPRIGGGFGGKQEILLEDLCSLLTIKTGKPVRMEYTRRMEFTSARTRHQQKIYYKIGIKEDKVHSAELKLIGDTGAYAAHGLTVNMVGGFKGLTLYNAPNSRFICDVVYTNTPVAGAFRGYGSMQEQFAIEVLMEEIAEKLAINVIDFKRDNWLKIDEPMWLSAKLGEGREGFEQSMTTSAFDACVAIGTKATDFETKRKAYKNQTGVRRKGIGMAVVHHGSGIAGLDMASATLKMNDDGSFNLLIGATDLGTGSDTILAQIAAEVLQIPVEDFIVYSSDTDFTPFDTGAYASSTTYISGMAVKKTAEAIRKQILEHAAMMMEIEDPDSLTMKDRKVSAPNGNSVSFEDVGLSSIHQQNQHQIMATESHVSYVSPPPTAAQFVEVEVDTETGEIFFDRMLMVADCGRVMNSRTAAGQVEGGMSQALGFSHSEDMIIDEKGRIANARFGDYHVYKANEMPPTDTIFVQTDEPSGPYGAKSLSELAIDGVAPALVSAVHDATGVWIHDLPLTPERVWQALQK
ncbi:MAG: molybdopterin-dependent oxidoreductase [Anaerolineaceae bacterium]|nr:molybdopterin-dependent oxidoreductase [Anaerolineaceae bacterium]